MRYDNKHGCIVDSYNRQNEANAASELSYDETIINDASLKQALLDNIKS